MGYLSMILENAVETGFLYILNRTIGGTCVILLVMAARLLLRRAPKAITFALWAVVALRLLIPFSIEADHSPVPVTAEPIPVDIGVMITPEIDTGIDAVDTSVNAVLPPAAQTASANPMQIVIFIASLLWLAGVIVFAVVDCVSVGLLRRRLRDAVPLGEGVWESPSIPSPFVWGILRPRIYLPSFAPEDARTYILAHERAHIRRRDMLWKGLGCVILTLHWFNPLVWAAFALFVADMEAACDEAVLRGADSDIRCAYGEALLSVAAGRRFYTVLPPSFGESDPKRRIRDVLNYKKVSRTAVIAAVIITAAVCIGCAFSRREEDEPRVQPDDSQDTAGISAVGGEDTPESAAYTLTFPAYSDTRVPSYVTICEETAPFTVTLTLPDGWTIGAPQSYDAPLFSPLDTLISPVCLYRDGVRIGSMGFYPIEYPLADAGSNEHFLAAHRLMMGNMNRWDSESWQLISENGSVKVGICDVIRRLDAWDADAAAGMMGAAMPSFSSMGIVAYDTEHMVMAAIELESDIRQLSDGTWSAVPYASAEELRDIAASISLSPGGERADWQVPTMQTAQITFPAYQGGRTDYNAAIYDTAPFTLTMELPIGWRLSIPAASAQTASLPFTPVTIRYGTETMGSVGFMTFELYEGMTPQDDGFYRMVYNQLMVSNLVTWDVDYTPIETTKTDTFCAATCKVSASIPVEGVPAAGWERRETEAIVAYDTEMLVYIAMDFAEGAVDETTWKAIAESIRLAPAEG